MPYGAGKVASGTFGTMAFQDADAVDITGGHIGGLSFLEVGIPSSLTGLLEFANSTNANLTIFQAGVAAASRTYTLPTDFGAAGSVLTDAAGNGTLSWSAASVALAIGQTISGGGANRLLYEDNSQNLGSEAALLYTTSTNTLQADNFAVNILIAPVANDGAPIGSAGLQFSDLFLAEGGVINWDNGDATLTQAGDVLTLAGADLKVTTPGNAATSVLTTDGAQTITGKTIGAGPLTLAEGAAVALDPVLSADGTFTGITITGTLGETVAFGEMVYLKTADSKWWRTDADADATAGAVPVLCCVQAGVADDVRKLLVSGNVRADAIFPALTVGVPVYLSTTTGAVQVAQPSGTDDIIRIVGYGLTADSMLFNASNDYLTHT